MNNVHFLIPKWFKAWGSFLIEYSVVDKSIYVNALDEDDFWNEIYQYQDVSNIEQHLKSLESELLKFSNHVHIERIDIETPVD